MSELRKAAQQALEALEDDPDEMVEVEKDRWEYKREVAWKVLRAALAQPELCADEDDCDYMPWCRIRKICLKRRPAALAQPEQEPVAWLSIDCIGERYLCFSKPDDNDEVHALYTSPPQRKPLTDKQYDSIEHKTYLSTISKGKPMGDYAKKLMRAIEKAHGIGGDV
jgi:hypothetical protein